MSRTTPIKARNNGKAGAEGFSRRERQIMDALYGLGRASAAQIHEAMAEPPSYTAVRTLLTILEKKGHVRHDSDGVRYVYEPVAAREDAGKTAIQTLKRTFFDDSAERLVAALLTQEDIAPDELDRLAQLIDKARREGR
jgi:predicted transcriptional regulator